jgi:hypothetical protein
MSQLLGCIAEALHAIGGDSDLWERAARDCEVALRAHGYDQHDSFLTLCADLLSQALETRAADRRTEVIAVLLATQHTVRGDALRGRRPA